MHAIETINLTKHFTCKRGFFQAIKNPLKRECTTALDNVSIKVNEGELFGVLGLNGAGKTTLIKILATLILPSSGRARVNGHDIEHEGDLVRESIGFVNNNERSFYWRLTGRENLKFYAALNNLEDADAKKNIDGLLELLDLEEIADKRFNTYSSGMKHRMSIARGLLNNPSTLFFDEPTAGLDVKSAEDIREFIKENLVKKQGKTILIATHNMKEAEKLCDRLTILHDGRVKATGSIHELKNRLDDESLDLEGVFKKITCDLHG